MENERAGGRPRRALLLAMVGLAALTGVPVAAGSGASDPLCGHGCPTDEPRFDGEYGLWVAEADGRLQVSWITREPGRGAITVRVGDRVVHRANTRSGSAHTTRFRVPRAASLVLEYGARADSSDRHRTLISLEPPRRGPPSFTGVDSLYVVGDVHGQFDELVRLLRNAGLLDDALRWTGGRAHLVMLGDIFDRGPDVTRILWMLYRLEREAAAVGGQVHVVLGNHEIMVFLDDLRYVSPKESMIAQLHGTDYRRMYDIRESVLGRWLLSKPAVLRINDVLMAHGGVTADYAGYSLETLDDTLASFLAEDVFYRWTDAALLADMDSAAVARRDDFFWGDNSVFWYRGYVLSDTAAAGLQRVLGRFGGDLHVVAHTAAETIQPRYAGQVIAVHPQRPATELLLLVWSPQGRSAYRYTQDGPRTPL